MARSQVREVLIVLGRDRHLPAECRLTAGGGAASGMQGIVHSEGRMPKIWDEMPRIWIEDVKMQKILL